MMMLRTSETIEQQPLKLTKERPIIETCYSTRPMLRISYFWPDWNSYGRLWVCSTLFSVQEVTFLFFPPKSLSQILEILSIRSMSRTCYQPTIDTAVIGKKNQETVCHTLQPQSSQQQQHSCCCHTDTHQLFLHPAVCACQFITRGAFYDDSVGMWLIVTSREQTRKWMMTPSDIVSQLHLTC